MTLAFRQLALFLGGCFECGKSFSFLDELVQVVLGEFEPGRSFGVDLRRCAVCVMDGTVRRRRRSHGDGRIGCERERAEVEKVINVNKNSERRAKTPRWISFRVEHAPRMTDPGHVQAERELAWGSR